MTHSSHSPGNTQTSLLRDPVAREIFEMLTSKDTNVRRNIGELVCLAVAGRGLNGETLEDIVAGSQYPELLMRKLRLVARSLKAYALTKMLDDPPPVELMPNGSLIVHSGLGVDALMHMPLIDTTPRSEGNQL